MNEHGAAKKKMVLHCHYIYMEVTINNNPTKLSIHITRPNLNHFKLTNKEEEEYHPKAITQITTTVPTYNPTPIENTYEGTSSHFSTKNHFLRITQILTITAWTRTRTQEAAPQS